MGNQAMMILAPHTMKRSRRFAVKSAKNDFADLILKTFDRDSSGTLNKTEVLDLCIAITNEVAPKIGVTEADVDMVMRVGGDTAKAEITKQEIPIALSSVLALKQENLFMHDLFEKYDSDKSGFLPKDQLSNLLTELNDGIIPQPNDIDFIVNQCDISGDGGIDENEIKGAVMAWYCLADESPLPSSVNEAKSLGYTDEQIDQYLEAQTGEGKHAEEGKESEGKHGEAK